MALIGVQARRQESIILLSESADIVTPLFVRGAGVPGQKEKMDLKHMSDRTVLKYGYPS